MVKVVKKRVRKGKPNGTPSGQSVNVSVRIGGGKKAGSVAKGKNIDKPPVDSSYQSPIMLSQPSFGFAPGSPFSLGQRAPSTGFSQGTVSMDRYNQPVLYPVEENIPQAVAYRASPMLPSVVEEPVYIQNKSGKSIPKYPIVQSPPSYEGYAYEEPIKSFEENKAYNELVRENSDMQSGIENSIRDAYNLYLNTTPSEPPHYEQESVGGGGEEELTEGPYLPPKAKGRPYSRINEDDIDLLERYLRIVTTIKPGQRNLNEQQTIIEGRRLVSNKRANPNLKPILDGIKARLEDEKK